MFRRTFHDAQVRGKVQICGTTFDVVYHIFPRLAVFFKMSIDLYVSFMWNECCVRQMIIYVDLGLYLFFFNNFTFVEYW